MTDQHDIPNLVPRTEAFDLAAYDVPHENPYLCTIRVDGGLLSRSVPHVSNIEYVRWLDRAAELHSDSLGFNRKRLIDEGIMWFVARHEIDYRGEVWGDDELVIATWVRDIRRAKSWRDYVIIRPADESIVCRAATLWVLVNLESRRPIRMTDEMISGFAPLVPPTGRRAKDNTETPCTSH